MSYQGLVYQGTGDYPIELPEAVPAGVGVGSEALFDVSPRNIVNDAGADGLTFASEERLENALKECRDVFRIKFGPDPRAQVAQLAVTAAKIDRPHRSPQRRYAPVQRAFIAQAVGDLEPVAAVHRNPSARCASPALAVPKPGSTKLRFTVDIRGPNSQTITVQSAMAHLDSMLQAAQGRICYSKIDIAHAY